MLVGRDLRPRMWDILPWRRWGFGAGWGVTNGRASRSRMLRESSIEVRRSAMSTQDQTGDGGLRDLRLAG